MGIRVWMEVGSGCSDDGWVVADVEDCVGPENEGKDDDDEDDTCWRFTKRRYWLLDAAWA